MLNWHYLPKNTESDGYCFADVGGLTFSCRHNNRSYKDGTRQYMVYLRVPCADSDDIITLTKVRGHLCDAQAKAEEFVANLFEALADVYGTEKENTKVTVVTSLEELKAYIEDKDWNIYDCGIGPDGCPGWEISQYSPAGEDFSFAIEHNGDVVEAVKEIKQYAYDFDEEEHAKLFIGANGAPGLKRLVEDAAEIQAMLDDLADGVNWCEQSTIGEIAGGV